MAGQKDGRTYDLADEKRFTQQDVLLQGQIERGGDKGPCGVCPRVSVQIDIKVREPNYVYGTV